MNLQLYHNEKVFSSQALEILGYLTAMEGHIEDMKSNKTNHMTEILMREIRQLTPELNRFRWTCLCVSLPKAFQDHSGDMYQILERLNWLVQVLQGFDEKKTASTSSLLSTTIGEVTLLKNTITVTREKLAKITHNLMQTQSKEATSQ